MNELEGFRIYTISEEDAAQVWSENQRGNALSPQPLSKQLTPMVDDVFISLFSAGRDPKLDPAAILWRQIMNGRSARIRRPFHVAWAMLRRLAQVNPIIGMCVRFLMQEFRTLYWNVVAEKREYEKTAAVARMLFRFPNPVDNWHTFLDKVVSEMLSIDAAPIEVWYGRYIPFEIGYERARLGKLQKALDGITDVHSPEYYEIKQNMAQSIARLNMLLAVEEERIRLLTNLHGRGETYILQEYSQLKEKGEALKKAIEDLPVSALSLPENALFQEIVGNHLQEFHKARDKLDSPLDLPIALIPLPGDQIEVWGDVELGMLDIEYPYRRVLFERIVGRYRRENLVYIREFNRADSFYGLSPVEAVLLVAYTYLIAHDVQFRFFTRSNIPAGLLVVPGSANVDTIRRSLREMLVSPERIAVLTAPPGSNAPTWIPLGEANRNVQFIDLLTWYVRLIILSFGLQTWEIGFESGSVNKRQLRVRPGIMGRMRFLESVLNDYILIRCFKADPSGVSFRFYGIDVGDFAEEANVLNSIVFKLMTLDEARARLGLRPLENGLSDYLFIPMGGQVFFLGKVKKHIDDEVDYDVPEKTVGVWSAIAGGMPKGLEAGGGGMFPAGPALLKAKEIARRGLVRDEDVRELERNFAEKQRAALKSFGKAMAALGVFSSPQEGYKFALTIFKEMAGRLSRTPSWTEFASELGGYLIDAYQQKLAKDVHALLAQSEDVTDMLQP